MNQNIIDKYEQWLKAENSIPDHEYQKGYKSRKAKARKLWRELDGLCKAEGLYILDVCNELRKPFKITLFNPLT